MQNVRRSGSRCRGYSLLEVAVAITLASIIAAVAVPSLRAIARASVLRGAARTLAGDLQKARGMVVSGRQDFAGWSATDRTVQAGVRFTSNTQYEIFVDRDRLSNGSASEVVILTRDLDVPIQKKSGPAEVRFRRNGTLAGQTRGFEISIEDGTTGRSRTLRVAFGGKTDIVR